MESETLMSYLKSIQKFLEIIIKNINILLFFGTLKSLQLKPKK